MSEYKLSQAINDLPDDLLQEAEAVKKPMRPLFRRVAAIAAVVAIVLCATLFWPEATEEIISMPGVLKVYACDLSEIDSTELEQYALIKNVENSYKTMWVPFTSLAGRGITICPSIKDEALSESEISIEISTNFGELKGDTQNEKYWVEGDLTQSGENASFGKHGFIDNNEVIYWTGYELWDAQFSDMTDDEAFESVGPVYVELIVRADDHIVGYAVMEVVRADYPAFVLQLVLKDSKYYPPVDGEYQDVTEAYVQQQISLAKNG